MKNTKKLLETYDVKVVIEKIEKATNQKAHLDTKLKVDYVIGNVTEQQLIDLGFVFVEMSNKIGNVCPIYRMGNIEAIFNGNLLYIRETL